MDWRLARSLETLRKQIDQAAPGRDKSCDGTIGDSNHQSRTSDHNPWVDGNVVTAFDVTHDPQHGVDCEKIAGALSIGHDRRIKYLIWNGHIANYQPLQGCRAFEWRQYHGANAHQKHLHISVRPNSTLYDDASNWNLLNALAPPPPVTMAALRKIASPPLSSTTTAKR